MKDRIDAILQRKQAQYLESLTPHGDALIERMEKFAEENGHPIADPEVAQFLRVLIRVHRPKRILEIGTNIGYSVVVMGRECTPDALIETIELDHDILSTARTFVADAALSCKVVFHEGAALDVLPALVGPFDFVFVDCQKYEYEQYLDLMLPKMPPGALVVSDNLLWKGKVAEGMHDKSTDGIRAYNQRLMNEPRLLTSILPLGDGTGVSVVV